MSKQNHKKINSYQKLQFLTLQEVTISFTYFEIEYHKRCDWDVLSIFGGKSGSLINELCGNDIPDDVIVGIPGDVIIRFTSDHLVHKDGFSAIYSIGKNTER